MPLAPRAQTSSYGVVGAGEGALQNEAAGAGLADIWPAEVASSLQTSPLVYLSPIHPTGALSNCQSELWFVVDGVDVLVVTSSQSWRVRALRRGLNTARFWVGDVGVASQSAGRYLGLPTIDATGRIDNNTDHHERAFVLFGEKYKTAWLFWKRRFKRGLAEGTRTMIRYSHNT